MPTIAEIRQKHPEYNDMSDGDLADKLHAKFYADMPREEFNRRIGYTAPDPAALRDKSGKNDPFYRGVNQLYSKLQSGASLGFSDELTAASAAAKQAIENPIRAGLRAVGANVEPGIPIGQRYDQALEGERATLRAAEENMPVASTMAELAGGIGTALIPAGGMASLGRGAKYAAAALEGAGQGALAGFGSGEGGFANRASSATGGAALGASLGVAGRAAMQGLGALGRTINEFVPADVRETAVRKIERALGRDKIAPADFAKTLQDNPELLPGAAGKTNVQGLVDTVVTRPGETSARARTLKESIADTASKQAEADLRAGLGTSGEFHQTMRALDEAKRAAARPLYEKSNAMGGNAWNDGLEKMMDRPSVRQGMGYAYKIAAEEGVDPKALGLSFNDAGDVVFEKVPSMATLDYVKRGLDAVVEANRDQFGKLTTYGRAADQTRRAWLSNLDEVNPDYKAARAAWAGPTRQQEAMREGEQFITQRPEEISEFLSDLGADEKMHYRLGVERKLMDVIENTADGADVFKRLIGNQRKRDLLKVTFESEDAYNQFVKNANDRIKNYNTLSRSLGGSQTEPRRQAAADFERSTGLFGDVVEGAASGGRIGALRALGRAGMARVKAPREDVANAVGEMLLPANGLERSAFIDRLVNGPAPGAQFGGALALERFSNPRVIIPLSRLGGQQAGLGQMPDYPERQQ